ncbi:hypothetical protein [Daejeonella oryzae]|uniref:hypothetical protein n=1 Tax=Daejeonella oryzae TaxID=1122943 RepID=UPI000404209D|nr:hypothetical protein [Daejeonella oryzae]
MKSRIETTEDLHAEILRLKLLRYHQEAAIEQDIKGITDKFRIPALLLHRIQGWFGDNSATHAKGEPEHDWVTNAFRIGLPVLLNKMVFGRAGFFIKSLVALASQKAATNVNKDVVTHWIDKAADWIRGASKNPKSNKNFDYGIPPDSETY